MLNTFKALSYVSLFASFKAIQFCRFSILFDVAFAPLSLRIQPVTKTSG